MASNQTTHQKHSGKRARYKTDRHDTARASDAEISASKLGENDQAHQFIILAKPTALILLGVTAVFQSFSLAVTFYPGDLLRTVGLFHFFNVNLEGNLPTLFSSYLLLTAAILALLQAIDSSSKRRKDRSFWLLLACLTLFMAVDEASRFHEMFISIQLIAHKLGWEGSNNGVFYYSWVIVGIPVVLVIFTYGASLIRQLPKNTAAWIAVAGFTYVAGALGGEMLGGIMQEAIANQEHITNGASPDLYRVVYHVEESLEMLGAILLIFATLKHSNGLTVRFGGADGGLFLKYRGATE